MWLGDYLKGFPGTFLVISHDTDFLSTITTTILDIEFGSMKKFHGNYASFIKQKAHLRKEYVSNYTKQQAHIEKTEAYIRKNKAGGNAKMARGRQKQLDRLERIGDPQINEVARFRFKETNMNSHRLLRVTDLEIGYDKPLLSPLNFELMGGEKIVITGFNGIGKSTLIKTLINEIEKLSGNYEFTDSVKFGYFEQDTQWAKNKDTPLQHLHYYFQDHTEKSLRQLLATCGVKSEHVARSINTLSGGEQAKVKLAHLILTNSNLLIMDEPTNHLDVETKEVLQTALQLFNGSVILVSHEKEFYDGWVDRIIKI